MLTGICIAVALLSPLVIGTPIRCLLSRDRPLDELDWIEAPFLGIAFIVVVHQALVYLNVPIRAALPFTWLVVVALWIAAASFGKIARSLRAFPRLAFAGALGVYLLHGAGLLWAGVDDYYGRAWSDESNYTAIAQFVSDEPFRSSINSVGQRPYLVRPITLKGERRIGQAVLQSFLSSSVGAEARLLFEPTILLGPALVFLGVLALCRILGRSTPSAFLVSAASALLPALALVHLESFLSQSLAIPLLVVLPALAWRITHAPDADHVVVAGAVLATAISVYPDFLLLYVVAIAPFLVATLASRKLRTLGHLCGAVALGLLLNPLTVGSLPTILRGATRPVLGQLYPWALKVEGLARIWFGDGVKTSHHLIRLGMMATAVGLTIVGYLGLGLAGRPWRRSSSSDRAGTDIRPLAIAILGLALLPLAIIARDTNHPYQFYKSLLTVAPLIALGLAFVAQGGRSGPSRRGAILPAIALIAATPMTTLMTIRSALSPAESRSGADILRAPAMKSLSRYLASLSGKSLVYWSIDDQWAPGYKNAWVSYFARRNRVWLCRPILLDQDLRDVRGAERFYDLGALPSDALFVSDNESAFLRPPRDEDRWRLEWTDGRHTVWSPSSNRWVTLANIASSREIEEKGSFLWMGADYTALEVLAGASGVARIHASFVLGPNLPRSSEVVLLVSRGAFEQSMVVGSGPGVIEVPVSKGLNRIMVRPVAAEGSRPLATGESPPLLLGMSGISVEDGGTPARGPS